jgi:hypothetical protein
VIGRAYREGLLLDVSEPEGLLLLREAEGVSTSIAR